MSEYAVVTAAHCVIDKQEQNGRNADQLVFLVGKSRLNDFSDNNFQILQIAKMITHPSWSPVLHSYGSDIAIAILKQPIKFNSLTQPICLPTKTDALDYRTKGSVAGWGDSEKQESVKVLKIARLAVVDRNVCIQSSPDYTTVMSGDSFCTELSEKGPCKGKKLTENGFLAQHS